MAIKEIPVSYKVYYKTMKEYANENLAALKNDYLKRNLELSKLYDTIISKKDTYKTNFNVNVDDYKEFVENRYINGEFLKFAKAAYMNKKDDYRLIADLYDLYMCAILQKEKHDFGKEVQVYEKMCSLTLKEYLNIVRTYYTEVQKKLILEGKGYAFEGSLGWICINRYKIRTRRKKINFAATKKREAELKAEGKKIYNKAEADWCKERGIEYNAEDKRVYLNDEYQYEIPLIGCKLPKGYQYKLERTDYRGSKIRGKTNQELLEECEYDKNKIMDLDLDMKSKLLLCVEADKMLYMNFIRNSDQTPIEFKLCNNILT